jgi:hypothetical protein
MSILLKTAAAVLAVLITPAAAAAQVWTDWGEAEGRQLIAAENGAVTEVLREADGSLRIYGVMDGWLHIMLVGSDCTGDGTKQRCKGLGFNGLFEISDPARAAALEHDLDFQYVADVADGGDLIIHRQVELVGGASLANLRAQLNGFIMSCELISDRIWPPKAEAGAADKPR